MATTTSILRDDQWEQIVKYLRACPDVYVGQEQKCRRFVEAVLWLTRTGAQWREIPQERFGNWNSIYKRYARWCEKRIWRQMHEYFAQDADLEYLIPDSTLIRAHPCAAGAPGEKGGPATRP
jgi:transposase